MGRLAPCVLIRSANCEPLGQSDRSLFLGSTFRREVTLVADVVPWHEADVSEHLHYGLLYCHYAGVLFYLCNLCNQATAAPSDAYTRAASAGYTLICNRAVRQEPQLYWL